MIVGILSDTHGKADMARAAVDLLLQHQAEFLVHCGDVGSEHVLDALAGHRAMFVFGNNDYDHAGLQKYAGILGIQCGGVMGKLIFPSNGTSDRRAPVTHGIVTHGDDFALIERILDRQEADYLFVGHTHHPQDDRQGKTRIINPGALYRATQKTVAVLDTDDDDLKFLEVKSPR